MNRMIKRLLCLIPAIFMMAAIFSFSSQEGEDSSSLSGKICTTIVSSYNSVFNRNMNNEEIAAAADKIEYPIRKLAHFTEYMILAFTIFLAVSQSFSIKKPWSLVFTEIITFIYACSDEAHQLFVSERAGSFKDVIIDSCGGLMAVLIIIIIAYRHEKGAD